LYTEADAGLAGFGEDDFCVGLQSDRAEDSPEVISAMENVSRLLAKGLSIEADLVQTPELYSEIMTPDVRCRLAKLLGDKKVGLALRVLPTIARHDLSAREMGVAEGLTEQTVDTYRYTLIKTGICERKGYDEARLEEMTRSGVGSDVLVYRYGSVEDAREHFGIRPDNAGRRAKRVDAILSRMLNAGKAGRVSLEELSVAAGIDTSTAWGYAGMLVELELAETALQTAPAKKRVYSPTGSALASTQILGKLGLEASTWNVMRYGSIPMKALYGLRLHSAEAVPEGGLRAWLGIRPEKMERLRENPIFQRHVRMTQNGSKGRRYYRLSNTVVEDKEAFFTGKRMTYPEDGDVLWIGEVLAGPKRIKQRKIVDRYEAVEGVRRSMQRIAEMLYSPDIMNFRGVSETLNGMLFGGRSFVVPRDVLDWVVFYGLDERLENVIKRRCERLARAKAVPYIVRDFISLLPSHRNDEKIGRLSNSLLFHPAYLFSMAGALNGNGYEERGTELLERYFLPERYAEHVEDAERGMRDAFRNSMSDSRRLPH